MATRAHSTRTPLLRPSADAPALLGLGLGQQPGPVTLALAAMRSADPDRLAELRRRIADRIEADLALLDALDGDADFEPSLGSLGGCFVGASYSQTVWSLGGTDDRENAECEDCDGEVNRFPIVRIAVRP